MAIKEKDLQTVNSIEGGKLRCVTANGESRNIDADAVSGSTLVCTLTYENEVWYLEESFEEITAAIDNGQVVTFTDKDKTFDPNRVCMFYADGYSNGVDGNSVSFSRGNSNFADVTVLDFSEDNDNRLSFYYV